MSSQSNTQPGAIVMLAGEDITTKEGYVAEIRNNSGVPAAFLPDAITDYAFYVINESGTGINTSVVLRPFEASRNHRIVLKGTCVPGDPLVLADPTTAADKGKLRKLPATSGTYRVLAIAEETGVDGQYTLVLPVPVGNVSV